MPQHARIEEVSDSDLDSNPSEQDPSDFLPPPLRPSTSTSAPLRPAPPQFRAQPSETDRHKRYQCLYPLYFDASRTRAQGRRVGHELAVQNPLAREIVEAVQLLGLDTVFEPGKVHPKDWSNPGRVRVLIKEGGRVRNRGVKNSMSFFIILCLCFVFLFLILDGNGCEALCFKLCYPNSTLYLILLPPPLPFPNLLTSTTNPCPPGGPFIEHHLYTLVAKHLLAHPTTPESPLRLRIHGMPPPTMPIPAPAVPRGWKMSSILPLHSPALSGGGVSENILQDMMAEMQGAGVAQASASGSAAANEGARPSRESGTGTGTGQGKRKRERDGGRKR